MDGAVLAVLLVAVFAGGGMGDMGSMVGGGMMVGGLFGALFGALFVLLFRGMVVAPMLFQQQAGKGVHSGNGESELRCI